MLKGDFKLVELPFKLSGFNTGLRVCVAVDPDDEPETCYKLAEKTMNAFLMLVPFEEYNFSGELNTIREYFGRKIGQLRLEGYNFAQNSKLDNYLGFSVMDYIKIKFEEELEAKKKEKEIKSKETRKLEGNEYLRKEMLEQLNELRKKLKGEK